MQGINGRLYSCGGLVLFAGLVGRTDEGAGGDVFDAGS